MTAEFSLPTTVRTDRYPVSHPPSGILSAVIPYFLAIATICYLYTTLFDGQMFNEDYAVYLQQAWNLAHHLPMRDMGVVQYFDPNLDILHQSPLTYPPLLPLIYALPVLAFGFNIVIFKTIQLTILLAALLSFAYAMSKWRFDVKEVSSSILIFTLCYYTRSMINSIDSDLPFILFLIIALLSADNFVRAAGFKRYWWGILSGASIFLAIDMRTVGVVLVPTLLLADLLIHQRFRFITLAIPGTIAAILWIGQWALGLSGASYGFVLHYQFFTPIRNIYEFYWALAQPLAVAAFPKVAIGILLILAALATIGLLYEAANGMTIAVFIVTYTVLLLVLPNFDAGVRYLVPHFLVLGAFAVRGATLIGRLSHTGIIGRQVFAWSTALLGVVWCMLVPVRSPSAPSEFGVTATSARDTFAFIREQTPPDALVAASKYRSFHLFTQRTTIRLPALHTIGDMLAWLHSHRVTEVVVKYSLPRSKGDVTDCPESPLCGNDNPDPDIKEVFRNTDFALFHVSFKKD
jgi:hypothetical protein